MNQRTRYTIIPMVAQTLILMIALFDSSNGLAIGTRFVTIPEPLTLVLMLIGNALWVLGLLLAVGTIATIGYSYVVDNNDDKMREALHEKIKDPQALARLYRVPIFAYSGMVIAFLLIASGFWFTGFAFVANIASTLSMRTLLLTKLKKFYP